jgi:hypothetical protein
MGASSDPTPRPGTTGAAFRRVHPSHHCWRIFTCAGLCWGGRGSALSKVSALASSPMRTIVCHERTDERKCGAV